jgi:hypothetical protein
MALYSKTIIMKIMVAEFYTTFHIPKIQEVKSMSCAQDSRKISFPILFPRTMYNWWGVTVFCVHRQLHRAGGASSVLC